MCIASGYGFVGRPSSFETDAVFAESPGRFVVELIPGVSIDQIQEDFVGVAAVSNLGFVTKAKSGSVRVFNVRDEKIPVDELSAAWRGTLDW